MASLLLRFLSHNIWTFVGVFVAVVIGILSISVMVWLGLRQAPTNTNTLPPTNTTVVNVNDRKPTPALTESPTPLRPPSPQPSPPPASPIASPPIQDPPRSVATQPPVPIANDIGQTKRNEFYEVTVENAKTTTDRVRIDTCDLDVPTGQRAIVIRFSIRWAPSKSLSAEEQFHLGTVQTSDFLLVDDRNRRVDTACQYRVDILSQMGGGATVRTLAYLVRADIRTLTFRFQKAGGGEAITFNLSGLD